MTMLAIEPQPSDQRWADIAAHAPELAGTARFYLDQIAVSLRPASVTAADIALRLFATWLIDADPTVRSLRQVSRQHVEGYKLWLSTRENHANQPLKKTTIKLRLGVLRVIFERLIEWDHPDAPARNPIFGTDLPKLDEPLPRFLDDAQAAAFMHAATRLDPFRRLVVEMLARTGMRVGELSALADDAVVQIGDTFWLRIPIGKLHNDRYIPLHPLLKDLLDAWRTTIEPDATGLLLTNRGRRLNRYSVVRIIDRCARIAGIGHVHPHQLRHTLATQAINRGMSLEAIAALLGHRSLRMTLVYARIADRTVADEYYAVTEQVEALYHPAPALPATAEGQRMRRLRAEHHRLLGNGYCTRPIELDCSFEAICERCAHYQTGPEFIPILRRQHDHAAQHDQPRRVELYGNILKRTTAEETP
jgi:integrase